MHITRTKLGAALTAATLLFGLTPTAAQANQAVKVDTSTAIGGLWSEHRSEYGKALSAEECFANGNCQQQFEQAVITWNYKTGAHAITGQNAQAFLAAGGAAKVGAIESDVWNHAQCGPAVTAYDGTTRWLVVTAGDYAGKFIDLNGEQANQWRSNRLVNNKCFADPAVGELPQTPAEPLEPASKEKPSDAAQAAAAKIAELKANTSQIKVGEAQSQLTKVSEDLYTQNFPDNISVIYSYRQNLAIWINSNALQAYLKDPQRYGQFLYNNEFRPNEASGKIDLVAQFSHQEDMSSCTSPQKADAYGYGLYSASGADAVFKHYYQLESQGDGCVSYHGEMPSLVGTFPASLMDRPDDPQGAVDNSKDWSQAEFIELQQVLELQDKESGLVYYIMATPEGTPLPGAKPIESSLLEQSSKNADRPRFSDYGSWAYGGAYNIYSDITMLGAPIAEEVRSSPSSGLVTVSQDFEGGKLIWEEGSKTVKVKLNAVGQAKKDWYKSQGF